MPTSSGRSPTRRTLLLVLAVVTVLVGASVGIWAAARPDPGSRSVGPAGPARPRAATAAPSTAVRPSPGAAAAGLTTFRGNATRDYYGEGPLPRRPTVL